MAGDGGGARRSEFRRHGPEVVGLEIERDAVVGREGGFLAIRRLAGRTRRADGSLSAPFLLDFLARPMGTDAVVVAVWARAEAGIRVLMREQLRPALHYGRLDRPLPVAEPPRPLVFAEVVAGIVEEGDRGEDGLRRRAALEVEEETGFAVDPDAVVALGAGAFPSPGVMPEKYWLFAVEVDPAAQVHAASDGSPLEEGAATFWLGLDQAIADHVAGELEDAKSELVLRRLRDHLARR